LRQRGEKRGLRGRQHGRFDAEVDLGSFRDSRDLIAVRREIEIEGEDLVFGQPVLQAKRDQRLTRFRAQTARRRARLVRREDELGDLLRDRRAPFNGTSGSYV
jgi:hypothetical protein